MRATLIQSLVEEVLPAIASGAKPEAALLKVAKASNFSHTQLEGLAQIYNTQKTLDVMEKSANRGISFHIVDVPALIEDYLRVEPEETKSAAINLKWEAALETAAGENLPRCFHSVMHDPEVERVEEIQSSPTYVSVKKATLAATPISKRVMENLNQRRFDLQEDLKTELRSLVKSARSYDAVPFEKLEADLLFVHGEDCRPIIEEAHFFLKSAHVNAPRAAGPGPKRLVREYPLFRQMVKMQSLLKSIGEVDLLIKEATATEAAARHETADPVGRTFFGDDARETEAPKGAPKKIPNPPGRKEEGGGRAGFKSPPPESPADGGKGGAPRSEKSFFGGVNDTLDSLVTKPGVEFATDKIKKVLGGGYNSDQQKVDLSMHDIKQMAMLQNLLTTDEVLSEADPEQVISIFNTVRQLMPSIASDPNIMRVTLRSAIQHEGISPFDVKGFLETQQAHQKVDWNSRQLNANTYGNQPLTGKPQ